jgi:hypothetical protein
MWRTLSSPPFTVEIDDEYGGPLARPSEIVEIPIEE